MPGVAAITGTLSYDEYSFDGSSRLSVEYVMVRDEAMRTVTHLEAHLSVTWLVQADAGTDSALRTLSARLAKQGRPLVFCNKGLGDDLIVNAPAIAGSLKDIKCGPAPESLIWKPIGDNHACEVTWRCTTYLAPTCLVSLGGGFTQRNHVGLMALNFSVDFDISEKGYTTRTTTGYLEVAQTREGTRLLDCADNYLNAINVPQLPDFQRRSQRSISASKSRMDFTITDSQIESPNAYPPGVTFIRARQRTRTKTVAGKPMRYDGGIDMEVETAANFSKLFGLRAFLSVFRTRTAGIASLPGNPLFIHSIDIEEELFSNRASYSVNYSILKKLDDFAAFKHWTPLGSDWRQWKLSLTNGAGAPNSARGMASLGIASSSDTIIDLCNQQGVPWPDPQYFPGQYQPGQSDGLRNATPDPQRSWLDIHQEIIPIQVQPTVRQATLQSPDNSQVQDNMNAPSYYQLPAPGGTHDVIQRGGRPRYAVRYVGAARRVGYPIPRPGLVALGGQTPVETGQIFRTWNEGDHLGVQVWSAVWLVDYLLPNSPGEVKPKPNLEEGQ